MGVVVCACSITGAGSISVVLGWGSVVWGATFGVGWGLFDGIIILRKRGRNNAYNPKIAIIIANVMAI